MERAGPGTWGPPSGPEHPELRAELTALKLRALQAKAEELGVSDSALDDAEDKEDVVDLIVDKIMEQKRAAQAPKSRGAWQQGTPPDSAPASALCYFCGEKGDQGGRGPLFANCRCSAARSGHGRESGYAHMSCLQDYIRMAEAHEQKVLANCPTCKQQYFGVMTVTMARKQFEEAKSEKQLHLWEIEESGLLRKLQTDENLVLEEVSQAQKRLGDITRERDALLKEMRRWPGYDAKEKAKKKAKEQELLSRHRVATEKHQIDGRILVELEDKARAEQQQQKDDEKVLQAASALSIALQREKQYDEALPLSTEALRTAVKLWGDDHPHTLTCRSNLALLHRARGASSEALPLAEAALRARRKITGDNHRLTLNAADLVCCLRCDLRLYEKALPLARFTLAGRRKILGNHHVHTRISIARLAICLWALEDLAGADPLYVEHLASCRKELGDKHLDTLSSLACLGQIRCAQRMYETGLPLLQESLTGRLKTLGEMDPMTVEVRQAQIKYEAEYNLKRRGEEAASLNAGSVTRLQPASTASSSGSSSGSAPVSAPSSGSSVGPSTFNVRNLAPKLGRREPRFYLPPSPESEGEDTGGGGGGDLSQYAAVSAAVVARAAEAIGENPEASGSSSGSPPVAAPATAPPGTAARAPASGAASGQWASRPVAMIPVVRSSGPARFDRPAIESPPKASSGRRIYTMSTSRRAVGSPATAAAESGGDGSRGSHVRKQPTPVRKHSHDLSAACLRVRCKNIFAAPLMRLCANRGAPSGTLRSPRATRQKIRPPLCRALAPWLRRRCANISASWQTLVNSGTVCVWEQQGPSRITAPMARPTFNVKNMAYKSLLPDGRPNPHAPAPRPVIQPPGGGPPSRPSAQAPAQVCKHLSLSLSLSLGKVFAGTKERSVSGSSVLGVYRLR